MLRIGKQRHRGPIEIHRSLFRSTIWALVQEKIQLGSVWKSLPDPSSHGTSCVASTYHRHNWIATCALSCDRLKFLLRSDWFPVHRCSLLSTCTTRAHSEKWPTAICTLLYLLTKASVWFITWHLLNIATNTYAWLKSSELNYMHSKLNVLIGTVLRSLLRAFFCNLNDK